MHAPQEKNQSVYGDLNWFESILKNNVFMSLTLANE